MAKTFPQIDALKADIDRLESIDPTPENRQMIAAVIRSMRGRIEQIVPKDKSQ